MCLLFSTEPRGAVCPPGLLTPLFHAQHATGKHSRSRVFIRRRSWRHPRAVVDRFADLPALYAVHDLCLLLEAGQRAQPKRASKAAKRHAYRGDTGVSSRAINKQATCNVRTSGLLRTPPPPFPAKPRPPTPPPNSRAATHLASRAFKNRTSSSAWTTQAAVAQKEHTANVRKTRAHTCRRGTSAIRPSRFSIFDAFRARFPRISWAKP